MHRDKNLLSIPIFLIDFEAISFYSNALIDEKFQQSITWRKNKIVKLLTSIDIIDIIIYRIQ